MSAPVAERRWPNSEAWIERVYGVGFPLFDRYTVHYEVPGSALSESIGTLTLAGAIRAANRAERRFDRHEVLR